MKIHVEQLKSQCVLDEDIILNTEIPLIEKDTVLEDKHIDTLKKFGVEYLEIEPWLANSKPFFPQELSEEQLKRYQYLEIENLFTMTVLSYKEVFLTLQSKGILNVSDIYEPLKKLFLNIVNKKHLPFLLHRLCKIDDYIYSYNVATAVLAGYLFYRNVGFIEDALNICKASMLCNIGLAKLNPKILRKKKLFTKSEVAQWEKHVLFSYEILSGLPGIDLFTKNIMIQHEEFLDGTGFPLKIKKDKICAGARYISIAEKYYMFLCPNDYFKSATPFEIALRFVKHQPEKFDQHIVKLFIDEMFPAFVGSSVVFQDGTVGLISSFDKKTKMELTVILEKEDEKRVNLLDSKNLIQFVF